MSPLVKDAGQQATCVSLALTVPADQRYLGIIDVELVGPSTRYPFDSTMITDCVSISTLHSLISN
jgi:Mrp family chromosome partitioning ATPase